MRRALYLLEDELDGERQRELRGYELATRLSYALWASAPDEVLLDAVASGALDTPEGLAAQVDRMLADPRVDRVRARFVRDWARLESLPDDDGLKGELIASAVAFYRDHLAEGGALFELFDARSARPGSRARETPACSSPEPAPAADYPFPGCVAKVVGWRDSRAAQSWPGS